MSNHNGRIVIPGKIIVAPTIGGKGDTGSPGAPAGVFRGDWDVSTLYAYTDTVRGSDGVLSGLWVYINATATTGTPLTDTNYWVCVLEDGADGANGQPGQDSTVPGPPGKEIELQASLTHIQWRYAGDINWIDLVALDDLKGADGSNGADGQNGADGSNGADGLEVELQKGSTHIQWRYVGEPDWTDLVALSDLKGADGTNGADGQNGADGTNGKEIELQKTLTHIQWRYVGDVSWTDLVALDDLKGDKGDDGADGTPGATYWSQTFILGSGAGSSGTTTPFPIGRSTSITAYMINGVVTPVSIIKNSTPYDPDSGLPLSFIASDLLSFAWTSKTGVASVTLIGEYL